MILKFKSKNFRNKKNRKIRNKLVIFLVLLLNTLVIFSLSFKNYEAKNQVKNDLPFSLCYNYDYLNDSDSIEYNVVTDNENLESNFTYSEGDIITNLSVLAPFEGLSPSDNDTSYEINQNLFYGKPLTIFGDDDRIRITPTTSYPWRTIVKLYITFDGSIYIGSGAIIDELHVLTAGHCVYSHFNGGWAESIKVVPGMDDGNEPYGHAWATNMRTYKRWIDYQDHQHDFAVITLDSNIGQQTGWMGLKTFYSYDPRYSNGLNVAGYPGDLDGGLNMYFDYDSGRVADEYNHWYYMDTTGGMSGSPVWTYDGTNRYILSVCAYGDDGSGSNHGTRIDRVKFDCIENWLTADKTSTQRPDMIDRGLMHSGFNPTTVGSGLTVFNVWSEIQNIGTVSTGTFSVSYYASLDAEITETDYFLGTDNISNIEPTEYTESAWLGLFPSNVPSGSYYIGWIIDLSDTITEFKENNNVGIMGSYKLLVDADSPSNPSVCVQINGSTISDEWQDLINDPNFTWSGAFDSHTGIDGYYYYWGPDSLGNSTSYTTTAGYNPPSVSTGVYYLRVSARDTVGNIAPWSTLYIFKYDEDLNENDDPDENPSNNSVDNNDDKADRTSEESMELISYPFEISELGVHISIWITCGILAILIQLYYKWKRVREI